MFCPRRGLCGRHIQYPWSPLLRSALVLQQQRNRQTVAADCLDAKFPKGSSAQQRQTSAATVPDCWQLAFPTTRRTKIPATKTQVTHAELSDCATTSRSRKCRRATPRSPCLQHPHRLRPCSAARRFASPRSTFRCLATRKPQSRTSWPRWPRSFRNFPSSRFKKFARRMTTSSITSCARTST